jgi:hypothetical protein
MSNILEHFLMHIRAAWRFVIVFFEWVMIAIGVALGLYIGAYIMLFGGVADAINLFKIETDVTAVDVIVPVLKIILSIPVGYLVAYVPIGISAVLINRLREMDLAGLPPETIADRRRKLGYDD